MKLNKRGQTVFLSVVVGIFFFMFGILFLTFISDEKDISMNSSNLDCDNPHISDGTKLTCLGFELINPYFILVICSIALASITARFR